MTDYFKKTCRIGKTENGSTFVTIEFKADHKQRLNGILSISGVEGPMSNDNCKGSCGQINLEPNAFTAFAKGWVYSKVVALKDIWDEWHLNDMSACDSVMLRDGWREKAMTRMIGYGFQKNTEMINQKNKIESDAKASLLRGELVSYTNEQLNIVIQPYSYRVWQYENETPPMPREGYKAGDSTGYFAHIKHSTLGHLYPASDGNMSDITKRDSSHIDGLLGRIHSESGNGYGAAWYGRDVPHDVLEWLKALPDSDIPNPWRD